MAAAESDDVHHRFSCAGQSQASFAVESLSYHHHAGNELLKPSNQEQQLSSTKWPTENPLLGFPCATKSKSCSRLKVNSSEVPCLHSNFSGERFFCHSGFVRKRNCFINKEVFDKPSSLPNIKLASSPALMNANDTFRQLLKTIKNDKKKIRRGRSFSDGNILFRAINIPFLKMRTNTCPKVVGLKKYVPSGGFTSNMTSSHYFRLGGLWSSFCDDLSSDDSLVSPVAEIPYNDLETSQNCPKMCLVVCNRDFSPGRESRTKYCSDSLNSVLPSVTSFENYLTVPRISRDTKT